MSNASVTLSITDADDQFGPAVFGRFDFTLLFEQSILSILPAALFLLLTIGRLAQLHNASTKTIRANVLTLKAVSLWLLQSDLAVFKGYFR